MVKSSDESLPIDPEEIENTEEHEYYADDLWTDAPEPDAIPSFLDLIPTDAREFVWTLHFGKRVKVDSRPPTLDMVNTVLEDGEYHGRTENAFEKSKIIDGIKILVLFSFDDDLRPELVTAYPEVVDIREAQRSEKFDKCAITQAHANTILHTQDPFSDDWVPLDLPEPLEKYGHTINTRSGLPYARCEDCGKQFTGKGQIKEQQCANGDLF